MCVQSFKGSKLARRAGVKLMTIKEALLSAVSSARRSGGANGEELRASTESALLVAHSMPLPAMETSVKMPDDELSCSDVLPSREECPGALLSPMLALLYIHMQTYVM
jgi:hypothetical protein